MKRFKKEQIGNSLILIIIIIVALIILGGIVLIIQIKPKEKNEQENSNIQNENLQEDTNELSTKITGTKPYLPNGFSKSSKEGETTLEEGMVIEDSSGNEYVWIPVPNDGTGPNYVEIINTQVKSDEYYEKIEKALIDYTSEFRDEFAKDNWTEYEKTTEEAIGIADYNELKRKMLNSVYTNGGFYVGRYETGMTQWNSEELNEETIAEMNSYSYDELKNINEPVIKKDAYPYLFVNCKQAQGLAEQFETGEYNSSLMFGVQWDLLLKYLKTIGSKNCNNSTNWGNYNNNSFKVTSTNAKQFPEDEEEWESTAEEKMIDETKFYTTGASDSTKSLNIYDIAGNVEEFTIEYNNYEENQPICVRGGSADDDGDFRPASDRNNYSIEDNIYAIGFRVSIY